MRLVSVERGFDPRDFALVCFGGAGPVHGVKLAHDLGMKKVLIPFGPGVTCALGLLMADFRHDYSQTFLVPVRDLDPARLTAAFAELEARATEQMIAEGFARDGIVFHRSADMRYAGQGYELEVPLSGGSYDRAALDRFCQTLGRMHCDSYGYEMASETAEVVTLRLVAIGQRVKPEFRQDDIGDPDPASALKGYRRVFMDGAFANVPVYERGKLTSGMRIPSAAIVEQVDSTTVLFPGYDLTVDNYRNLIIERREKHNG